MSYSPDHSKSNPENLEPAHNHVFSLKLYMRMFGVLIAFLLLNLFIYKCDFPSPFSTIMLLTVALIQASIVALFFMELIHEDKFYTFVFGACILFMILFVAISLAEITGRSFFHPDEGAHILRGYDKQGIYAPAAPQNQQSTQNESQTNTD